MVNTEATHNIRQHQFGRALEDHQVLTQRLKLLFELLQRLAQKTIPLWAEACEIAPRSGLGHQVNTEERVCALRAGQRRVIRQAQIGPEPVELTHAGSPCRECSGVRYPANHGSAVTQ